VIYEHPAVLEAAIVAYPGDKWGEVPMAHVTLKPDAAATDHRLLPRAPRALQMSEDGGVRAVAQDRDRQDP
jgi:acyl-CoA synthetase (AMP-forming)/AMP-acid ligase II